MAPKVLVSDKLSETAFQIFRDRGIDVTFDPAIGKDKEKLAAAIGAAVSSARWSGDDHTATTGAEPRYRAVSRACASPSGERPNPGRSA